jgi:AcrR family transcriptional regulator
MPRPSTNTHLSLLQSGRELFPLSGCKGMSLRAVAEHAGVNVGMFHYHFKTKDKFLDTLLQVMYEEMFASFTGSLDGNVATIEKLRAALTVIAHFGRENRRVLARLWIDAMAGEKVAVDFFQRNAPRHFSVLFKLLEQAEREGEIQSLPPLQRFVMLAGSIFLPIIFVSGLIESASAAIVPFSVFEAQVLSDEAIAQRVDLVLTALRGDTSASSSISPLVTPRKPRKMRKTQ